MRELLGGKGANVAEMTRVLGEDRVPAGFTITTEACVEYMRAGQEEPEGLAEEVAEALGRLEERAGKKLGDNDDPLLVSVRSGAREHRRIKRSPDDWGTAVNVQQMGFGNQGDTSATGVAFSRDEVTGAPEPSGDFLVNAQGEDVVSGVRNTRDIGELADVMPDA